MTDRPTIADMLIDAVALVNALHDECQVQYEARVKVAVQRWVAGRDGDATAEQIERFEAQIRAKHPAPVVLDLVGDFRARWTDALADPNVVVSLPSRRSHPETAHEAAWLARPNAATHRGLLLIHFAERGGEGLSAFEAWQLLVTQRPKARMHNISTRIAELVERGWLVLDTDAHGQPITRPTDTGAQAQVYVFNPLARDEYNAWLRESEREAG